VGVARRGEPVPAEDEELLLAPSGLGPGR
jgi:hypothetical protein